MKIKPMHNKKEFYKMCKALEDNNNLAFHYERQGDKIEFIYRNKLTKKETTIRYEKR